MACALLFTRPPLPPFPDFKVPRFLRSIALFTDFAAAFPYLAIVPPVGSELLPRSRLLVVVRQVTDKIDHAPVVALLAGRFRYDFTGSRDDSIRRLSQACGI
jgi:hypothetical protein